MKKLILAIILILMTCAALAEETVMVSVYSGGRAVCGAGEIKGFGELDAKKGFTIKFVPDEGYTVDMVTVDGVDVGAATSYTFSDMELSHILQVRFREKNASSEPRGARVYGTITQNGKPVAGLKVMFGNTATYTAKNGNYAFYFAEEGANELRVMDGKTELYRKNTDVDFAGRVDITVKKPVDSALLAEYDYEIRTVSASKLNLRAAPSTDADVVDTVRKGDMLYCVSTENGWATILYGDEICYAADEYLK